MKSTGDCPAYTLPEDTRMEHFDDPDGDGIVTLVLRRVDLGCTRSGYDRVTWRYREELFGTFLTAPGWLVSTSNEIKKKALGLFFRDRPHRRVPEHFRADVDWFQSRYGSVGC